MKRKNKMNFTTDELYMIRWIVRRYKTDEETDEEKQEIETIKKKLVFMCKANNFAENVMKDVHLDKVKDAIQFDKVKPKQEVKEEKKVLDIELPTILISVEKYNLGVNNCKKNKSGSSWCYLTNQNNARRKIKLYNGELIYRNDDKWGLFKKGTTQLNENMDNQ